MHIPDQVLDAVRTEGFAVMEGFLAPGELAAAREGVFGEFPRPEDYFSDPEAHHRVVRHQFAGLRLAPYGSWDLNRLAFHPDLVDAAERFCGTADLDLYKIELWAKYAGAVDYDQPHHRDFGNHSLVVPRADRRWPQLTTFTLLSDVTEADGPTRIIPRSVGDQVALIPPEKSFGELFDQEVAVTGPAGSIFLYTTDVLHRGSNMTGHERSRFALLADYAARGNPWMGKMAWPAHALHPAWPELMARATVRERDLFGFPPSGHEYWRPDAGRRRRPVPGHGHDAVPTGGRLSPTADLGAARAFLRDHGRVLEQRLAECRFDGAGPEAVIPAVLAYRNPDGGFGHSLEPDTRCPHSQPLYAQVALESLATAGARAEEARLDELCDHLAAVAEPGGALPIMVPSFVPFPKAAHWEGVEAFPAALNPTAAIAGRLHQLGVRHRWLDDATGWCFDALDRDGLPTGAHELHCVLALLDHAPDRRRADAASEGVAAALSGLAHFRPDPADPAYGLTPLNLAPEPGSRWRALFDDQLIAAHLDLLVSEQEADGGWPLRWDPPTDQSILEWRGILTLRAISTLAAYGRTSPDC